MQEVTVQVCRWVGAMFNTALDALSAPWGIVHVHCSTGVSEGLQVGGGLVRDVVDVIGEVGRASHLVDEGLPGGSSTEASGQRQC